MNDALARKIQNLHLIATGKVCALPPPQEVVDLYLWTESRRRTAEAEEANAKAKWKELSAEEKTLLQVWNPSLFKKWRRLG